MRLKKIEIGNNSFVIQFIKQTHKEKWWDAEIVAFFLAQMIMKAIFNNTEKLRSSVFLSLPFPQTLSSTLPILFFTLQ